MRGRASRPGAFSGGLLIGRDPSAGALQRPEQKFSRDCSLLGGLLPQFLLRPQPILLRGSIREATRRPVLLREPLDLLVRRRCRLRCRGHSLLLGWLRGCFRQLQFLCHKCLLYWIRRQESGYLSRIQNLLDLRDPQAGWSTVSLNPRRPVARLNQQRAAGALPVEIRRAPSLLSFCAKVAAATGVEYPPVCLHPLVCRL